MSLYFPNGTVFGFSLALAPAVLASAIANASPAVATVAADSGLTEGDVLVVKSTWTELDQRVGVAGAVSGTTVPLIGLDTTDTDDFPDGSSTGSLIKVTEWIDFSQQGDLSTSGGDQQYWTGQFLESRSGRQISVPTYTNAKQFSLPLYFDPNLPWYPAAKKMAKKRQPVVLRMRLPDGDTIYRYGYMSFDSDPTASVNNPMQNTMSFSALTEHTFVPAEEEAGS